MSSPVTALLLAAGQSRRMGSCKQLLPLGETTVLGRCLTTLTAAGVAEILVVVAPNGEAVARAAREFPVRVAVNPEPAGDMASSVRTGRDHLAQAAHGGVIVALCDYPLVQPATVRQLIEHHRQAPEAIVIPTHAGQRGHPLLFPRQVLAELAEGQTLRDLVRRDPQRCHHLAVDDPGILQDMDTPQDYRLVATLIANTPCT